VFTLRQVAEGDWASHRRGFLNPQNLTIARHDAIVLDEDCRPQPGWWRHIFKPMECDRLRRYEAQAQSLRAGV